MSLAGVDPLDHALPRTCCHNFPVPTVVALIGVALALVGIVFGCWYALNGGLAGRRWRPWPSDRAEMERFRVFEKTMATRDADVRQHPHP